jgi:2-polyprenyl-3-methyl-5-hydroxy-6-metoxy-1,4-benzoquinol methylase
MLLQPVQQFYDELSGEYHLLFPDWRDSVRWQGHVLDTIIQRELDTSNKTLLDCSCGIGTQAIGLALQGYEVHGTDVSLAAIKRAEKETKSFGVKVSFSIANILTLDRQVSGTFDIVISCDNSLPHLLTDSDLLTALKNTWSKLEPGGLFISSIRDYDQIVKDRPRFTAPREFDGEHGRRIVFQTWEWLEGARNYLFHLFILIENQGNWTVSQYTTQYRTLLRKELTEILYLSGYSDIHWLMPIESGYYQPIVIAHKNG